MYGIWATGSGLLKKSRNLLRAINSVGECHPHTVEATGSNPVSPNFSKAPEDFVLPGPFCLHCLAFSTAAEMGVKEGGYCL